MGPDAREAREVGAGPLHVWLAPGVDPHAAIGPDVDPDRLLTDPDCRVIKLQRKVMVGRAGDAQPRLPSATRQAWTL